MTLIKSKINSLAWIKSAIYISVVGGIIISSKPVSAINFNFKGDSSTLATLSITQNDIFGDFRRGFSAKGTYWETTAYVIQEDNLTTDSVSLNVTLQHIKAAHPGDTAYGKVFSFTYSLNAKDADSKEYETSLKKTNPLTILSHPGRNHSDKFDGTLIANVLNGDQIDRIKDWSFNLTGEHRSEPVPEPTTMLTAAVALGYGGWLKRKNLIKQDKTKSQG